MTPFCFEHVFVADSPATVLAAYFDAGQVREQDRALDIVDRQILEFVDGEHEVVRVSRVVPRRQLPTLLRPFQAKQLFYIERATWPRATTEIAVDIRLLGDRGLIDARYRVDEVAPGAMRRRYSGHVSVNIALVAARVERGIALEFEHSLERAAACTQTWLDRQSQRSVAARA